MFIAALVCTGGSVILQDSTGVLQASSPHPHSIIPPTHPTSLTPPLPHPSPALSEEQHAHSARRPSPNLSVHATGDTGCVRAMGGVKPSGRPHSCARRRRTCSAEIETPLPNLNGRRVMPLLRGWKASRAGAQHHPLRAPALLLHQSVTAPPHAPYM